MTTKLRTLKRAAFAVCCAAGLAATPLAFAASSFDISVGTGPVYYNGYYYPRSHCWRDYYGYVRCNGPYYSHPAYYYNGPYYSPGVSVGYYNYDGYHDRGWRDHDWRWHDRWHDRDDWRDRNDR